MYEETVKAYDNMIQIEIPNQDERDHEDTLMMDLF